MCFETPPDMANLRSVTAYNFFNGSCENIPLSVLLCPCVCLSVCLSVRVSVCPCVCLSVSPLSLSLSLTHTHTLSLSLSLSLSGCDRDLHGGCSSIIYVIQSGRLSPQQYPTCTLHLRQCCCLKHAGSTPRQSLPHVKGAIVRRLRTTVTWRTF